MAVRVSSGTEEPKRQAPLASLLLAFAATVPMAAGAAAALALPRRDGDAVEQWTVRWAGGVLCFLSGVRRGLSFRQPGGSTLGEVGTMFSMFLAGIGGVLLPSGRATLSVLLLGYAGTAVGDVRAAQQAEAPRFFARLRPAQMLVPLVSLALLLARRRR